MRIGFVGLGVMGGKLASRLVGVGELAVYDMSARAMEPFRGRARLGASIKDSGVNADVVGVCVANDAQVIECVAALLPVMQPGAVLMIHSTVSPETVLAAARQGKARGVEVIDAAVTVTRYDDADGPFVCAILGGDVEIVERTRPLLDAYATDTVHVGQVGSAMSLKIINNLVSLVQITVAEEAFRLATLTGVSADAVQAVMMRNGILTPVMKGMAARVGQPPADLETLTRRQGQARNCVKDLALAEALARSVQTPSAAATFAKEQFWYAYTTEMPVLRS